ncbi:MAG: methylated-DNA--[protein]-cysteine S-methyltransferase [Myxococcales bacterium]|nr:methylated-DNA--[protein]-cysteine S-methyltransferase [Myxococcales bacterium]
MIPSSSPSPLRCAVADTRLGALAVAWNSRGVAGVSFAEPSSEAALRTLSGAHGELEVTTPSRRERVLLDGLARMLAGERVEFEDEPLDDSTCSKFQRAVYRELRRVPWGETVDYGTLAARVDRPHGARAVGQALRKNPFPLVVPCHRVLASTGHLGGFSAGQGALTKARLLTLEGAAFCAPRANP